MKKFLVLFLLFKVGLFAVEEIDFSEEKEESSYPYYPCYCKERKAHTHERDANWPTKESSFVDDFKRVK